MNYINVCSPRDVQQTVKQVPTSSSFTKERSREKGIVIPKNKNDLIIYAHLFSPSNLMEFGSLPLSPCFWLALSLLSWGYLVFSDLT